MFCKHCGREIDNDSLFCQYCGRSLVSMNIISRNKSLNSKSKDELITIVLRKDQTERKHTKLIQELKQELSKIKNCENTNINSLIMINSKKENNI